MRYRRMDEVCVAPGGDVHAAAADHDQRDANAGVGVGGDHDVVEYDDHETYDGAGPGVVVVPDDFLRVHGSVSCANPAP